MPPVSSFGTIVAGILCLAIQLSYLPVAKAHTSLFPFPVPSKPLHPFPPDKGNLFKGGQSIGSTNLRSPIKRALAGKTGRLRVRESKWTDDFWALQASDITWKITTTKAGDTPDSNPEKEWIGMMELSEEVGRGSHGIVYSGWWEPYNPPFSGRLEDNSPPNEDCFARKPVAIKHSYSLGEYQGARVRQTIKSQDIVKVYQPSREEREGDDKVNRNASIVAYEYLDVTAIYELHNMYQDDANDLLFAVLYGAKDLYDAGYCHMDLKLDNMMGRPWKIIDLGSIWDNCDKKAAHGLVGSFAYMAPGKRNIL